MMADAFSIINIVFILIVVGLGIYTIILLIKALKINNKK